MLRASLAHGTLGLKDCFSVCSNTRYHMLGLEAKDQKDVEVAA